MFYEGEHGTFALPMTKGQPPWSVRSRKLLEVDKTQARSDADNTKNIPQKYALRSADALVYMVSQQQHAISLQNCREQ